MYGLLDHHTGIEIYGDENGFENESVTQCDEKRRFIGDKFHNLKCQV